MALRGPWPGPGTVPSPVFAIFVWCNSPRIGRSVWLSGAARSAAIAGEARGGRCCVPDRLAAYIVQVATSDRCPGTRLHGQCSVKCGVSLYGQLLFAFLLCPIHV